MGRATIAVFAAVAVAHAVSGSDEHVSGPAAARAAPQPSIDFERFARADGARERGGTGLGLAIVAAIARAHGGTAHAANLDVGGADVWIVLPTRLNDVDAPGPDRSDVR